MLKIAVFLGSLVFPLIIKFLRGQNLLLVKIFPHERSEISLHGMIAKVHNLS